MRISVVVSFLLSVFLDERNCARSCNCRVGTGRHRRPTWSWSFFDRVCLHRGLWVSFASIFFIFNLHAPSRRRFLLYLFFFDTFVQPVMTVFPEAFTYRSKLGHIFSHSRRYEKISTPTEFFHRYFTVFGAVPRNCVQSSFFYPLLFFKLKYPAY